ncbi:MAG: bifunctional biotin--[acetyl-CoA-carboxylase] ligase/biotin operon repressor BirA [Gammaproteobacteria bacterium]|jgi:BirA family biotin operon repressor/biotin-[acetyl-CoA-carboxylase] ligase
MSLRSQLLKLLAHGGYQSGEALGATLGVSRMAVWKHLKALRTVGVPIEILRGRGYRLPDVVELLDRDEVLGAVTAPTREQLGAVEVCLSVDSTNNRLREMALNGAPSGTLCLAEMQYAGRGRRGRRWESPFGANLYLSLLWRSPAGVAAMGGLSLVAGIALMRTLKAFGITTAGLKWPNDIMVANAKLGGILIDVLGEATGPCVVIIGVGVNVAMPRTAAAAIDQPWTDLRTLTGNRQLSRNRLAALLLDNLLPLLAVFESDGMPAFLDEWKRYDLVDGHQVELHVPGRVIAGRACGIDANGALLLETGDGRRCYASGELSLRRTE